MASPDFTIRRGDDGVPFAWTLVDAAGAAVDIEGATVAFTATPIGGGPELVDDSADNEQVGNGSDGSKGHVSYTWQSTATATPGLFLATWVVTFAGGTERETFPVGGFLLVEVLDLAPTDPDTLYVELEELKAAGEIEGTYLDNDIVRAINAACRAIDAVLGRRFYLDRQASDRFYAVLERRHAFTLEIDDLSAAPTSLLVDDDGDNVPETALTVNTDYVLEPLNALADGRPYERIHFERALRPGRRAVQISGIYGWPKVPDVVKQAAPILANKLVRRIRDTPFGVVTAGSIDTQIAIRILRSDPDVAFLLSDTYMRGALVA